ncbi:MAG: hypothetical protein LBH96_05720 [Candidatus Peribacteria bacterium]|jgi:hypothetical protein|nr:hypothetical protein [Candidatus Peribacteria bacterium]
MQNYEIIKQLRKFLETPTRENFESLSHSYVAVMVMFAKKQTQFFTFNEWQMLYRQVPSHSEWGIEALSKMADVAHSFKEYFEVAELAESNLEIKSTMLKKISLSELSFENLSSLLDLEYTAEFSYSVLQEMFKKAETVEEWLNLLLKVPFNSEDGQFVFNKLSDQLYSVDKCWKLLHEYANNPEYQIPIMTIMSKFFKECSIEKSFVS